MTPEHDDLGSEPPVEPEEYLLRHFPSHPSEYDFTKKFARVSVFSPRNSDQHGLSLNREGDDDPYPTARSLLDSARNADVRQYGGVIAVKAEGVLGIKLTVTVSKGDLPGHVEIRELNREDYDRVDADGGRSGKRKIKDLMDKLIRLPDKLGPTFLLIRIHPREKT